MLVKQWEFGPNATGNRTFPFLVRYAIASKVVNYMVQEFRYIGKQALPGQNNTNPPGIFQNHALVKYNTVWYDPSYGTGGFSELWHWEREALSGYMSAEVPDNNTGVVSAAACRLIFEKVLEKELRWCGGQP
jgi:hypothetical protein